MKRLFFILSLLPVLSFAQNDKYPESFWSYKPDSTCLHISLPGLARSDLYKVYEIGRKSSYFYTVNHDSVYYRIFSLYSKDSLPVFDFSKQELLVRILCHYCVGLGTMDGEPRHRNACAYRDFWYVRDKKKD